MTYDVVAIKRGRREQKKEEHSEERFTATSAVEVEEEGTTPKEAGVSPPPAPRPPLLVTATQSAQSVAYTQSAESPATSLLSYQLHAASSELGRRLVGPSTEVPMPILEPTGVGLSSTRRIAEPFNCVSEIGAGSVIGADVVQRYSPLGEGVSETARRFGAETHSATHRPGPSSSSSTATLARHSLTSSSVPGGGGGGGGVHRKHSFTHESEGSVRAPRRNSLTQYYLEGLCAKSGLSLGTQRRNSFTSQYSAVVSDAHSNSVRNTPFSSSTNARTRRPSFTQAEIQEELRRMEVPVLRSPQPAYGEGEEEIIVVEEEEEVEVEGEGGRAGGGGGGVDSEAAVLEERLRRAQTLLRSKSGERRRG